MRRPRLILPSLVVLSVALVACSDSDTGVPRCTPGDVDSCPCPDGSQSQQTCLNSGFWGLCQCDIGGDGVSLDVVGADVPVADAPVADLPVDVSIPDVPPDPWFTGDPGTVAAPDIPWDGFVTVLDGGWAEVPPSEHCDPCGYGAVKGIVCAPNAQIFVANALVTITVVDCDGTVKSYQTMSESDGTYYFPSVPCGMHTVHVKAGQFEKTYAVQVKSGQLNDHTGAAYKLCFAAGSVPIAVWWGQWDDQQELVDELGFDFTYYNFEWEYFNEDINPADIEAVQVLRDPVLLAQYKILFFNCGSAALKYVNMFPEIEDNLRDFVLAGGSMYASDLSWAYIEGAFPDAIDFYGSNDLPSGAMTSDGPQQVQGQQTYPATVEDGNLAAYVGVASFDTFYGPGPLIAIEAPGADTQLHVSGVVHVDPPSPAVCGDGVCDSSEIIPLCTADCASIFDVDDYAEHDGPMVLSFRPGTNSGSVIYTTFHNDEQADELMKKILYYLVFLL